MSTDHPPDSKPESSHYVRNGFIGLALTALLCVYPGFASFFLPSILCTGGLTLVIWIPVWILIGWVVSSCVKAIVSPP